MGRLGLKSTQSCSKVYALEPYVRLPLTYHMPSIDTRSSSFVWISAHRACGWRQDYLVFLSALLHTFSPHCTHSLISVAVFCSLPNPDLTKANTIPTASSMKPSLTKHSSQLTFFPLIFHSPLIELFLITLYIITQPFNMATIIYLILMREKQNQEMVT